MLSKEGMEVTIIEKNNDIGGRARRLEDNGYTFDMGPSWYWMHDIFENFFNRLNYKSNDLYNLVKLDPGFKMIFKQGEICVPADFRETCKMFDDYEENGAEKLKKFMSDAKKKYDIGMDFLYNSPGISFKEILHKDLILNLGKLDLLSSYKKHVRKYFTNPLLIHLLEFPILFLGSTASKTPALYSLISYSGIKKGTFYPMGGFFEIVKAMEKICKKQGVHFLKNEEVIRINIKNKEATSLTTNKQTLKADIIIASSDYAHVEKHLIEKKFRNYNDRYWEKKDFAPSALIFYLGVNQKLNELEHHNLFFDEDIKKNTEDIYKYKRWNKSPLFYVCRTSKTDKNVAPPGKENMFILMPISIGIKDTEKIREKYFKLILSRIEKYTGKNIKENIEYKKSYCINDFKQDYNAYGGNAYGLANTLSQTANLKPKMINKKVKNLFYTGQLTVPGPGVPPSIISGQLIAEHIIKSMK